MSRLPLPLRDGVGPSRVALPEGHWPSIAAFLAQRFGHIPRAVWDERIRQGEVTDAHGVPVTEATPYRAGSRIYYYRNLEAEPEAAAADERVLWRDDHLLVVDKPHFLPVAPVGAYVQRSLLVRLRRRLGLDELVPLHRIDRETAGVVLFSLRPDSRAAYHALFAHREIEKTYEAIVPWRAGQWLPATRISRLVRDDVHFMQAREVPGAPNAETRFALIEQRAGWARLGLMPVTGRRHQLRAHCAALGMPILNDAIYPRLRAEGEADDPARPLQLLAKALAFRDPLSGAPREFASEHALALPPEAAAAAG